MNHQQPKAAPGADIPAIGAGVTGYESIMNAHMAPLG